MFTPSPGYQEVKVIRLFFFFFLAAALHTEFLIILPTVTAVVSVDMFSVRRSRLSDMTFLLYI